MNFLHMEFSDIKFNIYSRDEILANIKLHWELTLCNVKYNDNEDDCWKIEIDLSDENEHAIVNQKNKTIYYKVYKQGYINSINSFIREFVIKSSLTKGYLWFHASIFDINKNGIMVVGAKASGKSTHMLNACLNYDAKVVGNDQNPLVVKEGKLFSYRWRPDAKFSASSLHVVGAKEDPTNVDKLMWMPRKNQFGSIDIGDLSKSRNQSIGIYYNPKIKIKKTFECEIKKILFLVDNEEQHLKKLNSEEKKTLIKEAFYNDNENINYTKFTNWSDYMPYWNKRILGLKVEDGAKDKEISTIGYIVNKIDCYQIYRRMALNDESFKALLED